MYKKNLIRPDMHFVYFDVSKKKTTFAGSFGINITKI